MDFLQRTGGLSDGMDVVDDDDDKPVIDMKRLPEQSDAAMEELDTPLPILVDAKGAKELYQALMLHSLTEYLNEIVPFDITVSNSTNTHENAKLEQRIKDLITYLESCLSSDALGNNSRNKGDESKGPSFMDVLNKLKLVPGKQIEKCAALRKVVWHLFDTDHYRPFVNYLRKYVTREQDKELAINDWNRRLVQICIATPRDMDVVDCLDYDDGIFKTRPTWGSVPKLSAEHDLDLWMSITLRDETFRAMINKPQLDDKGAIVGYTRDLLYDLFGSTCVKDTETGKITCTDNSDALRRLEVTFGEDDCFEHLVQYFTHCLEDIKLKTLKGTDEEWKKRMKPLGQDAYSILLSKGPDTAQNLKKRHAWSKCKCAKNIPESDRGKYKIDLTDKWVTCFATSLRDSWRSIAITQIERYFDLPDDNGVKKNMLQKMHEY